MRRIGRIVGIGVALAAALLLNYYLPSREIVRVVGTDVVRMDAGPSQSDQAGATRDVRLINAVQPDGDPVVFRNEDTGWGWPPYFKFDSADIAAQTDDAISTDAAPRWMVVTSYGWRVPFLSRFPNAVALQPAEGPDETLIPWFNLTVIALLVAGVALVRRRILGWFAG